MMATDATVLDPLAFGCEFGSEFPRGVDAVVRAVVANVDAGGRRFTLEPDLGLHSLSPGEPHLVNYSELCAGGVTEDGTPTKLLGGEIVSACRELTAKKRRLILIREYQVPGGELVHLENAVGGLQECGTSLGRALLLAKLAGCTFGRMDGSRAHFHPEMTKDPAATEPLGVLPPEMVPLRVPQEQALLERGKIGSRLLRNPFKSKGLGSGQDVMESADNGKGGLAMVPDGDVIAVGEL
jgi:hypothetical protein